MTRNKKAGEQHEKKKTGDTAERYSRTIAYFIIAAAGLTAVWMVLTATSLYGPGLSSDAISYISTAKHLLQGRGFLDYNSEPYTHWPPLLPLLTAAISGATGISGIQAIRFINAVSLGAVVVLSGILFRRRIKSLAFVLFGVFTVLLCFTFLRVSTFAWTEPLFVALTLMFVLCMVRFLEEKKPSFLVIAAFFTALSCLQRYVGVATILAGGAMVVFLERETKWRVRIFNGLIFGVISSLPLAIWVLRNKLVAGTAGEYRLYLDTTLRRELTITLDSITPWLVSPRLPLGQRLLIVGIFIAVLAVLYILRRYKVGKEHFGSSMLLPALWIYIGIYTVFTVTASVFVNADADDRIFSTIFPFIVLLVLVGFESIAKLLTLVLKKETVWSLAIAGLCSLWLVGYCLPAINMRIAAFKQYGVGGYNSAYWNFSPVVDWLNKNGLEGQVYSNEPQAVYYWTEITANMSPLQSMNMDEFKASMSRDRKNFLIWFHRYWPRNNYDLKELSGMFRLRLVAELPDGVILTME